MNKQVVVSFDDLVEAKNRVDNLTYKYDTMVKNGVMFNSLAHTLLKRDAALNAFYMAASIYYNNTGLTVERLEELFEEEKKYHSAPLNQSSQSFGSFFTNRKNNNDFNDEIEFFDDEEVEFDEEKLRGI